MIRGAFVADSLNWFIQKRTHCRAPAQREVSRRVTQNSQGVSATFHEVTVCASQSEHLTDYFCDPRLLILQWHAESAPFSSPLFSKRLAILSKFHCWQWAQLALCPGLRISYSARLCFLKRLFARSSRTFSHRQSSPYSCSISLELRLIFRVVSSLSLGRVVAQFILCFVFLYNR